MSIRFASSQRNDMRPLAFQGILATDCYDQLQNVLLTHEKFLERHGMPQASSFLAEPMHDKSRGTIDWYAAGRSMPVPLSSLSANEQANIQQQLATYSQAIQALMNETKQHGSSLDPMGLDLLALAMQHPSPDDIWVQDNRPVLINWGFHPGVQGAQPEDIMRSGLSAPKIIAPVAAAAAVAAIPEPAQAATPPPPQPEPEPVAAAAAPVAAASIFPGCLGWLLPLLALLLLLWLLLAALGFFPSPLPGSCFHQDVAGMDSEKLRTKNLDAERERLLKELQERAALCKPAPKEDLHAERAPILPEMKPQPEEKQPEPVPEKPQEALPFFGAAPVIPKEPEVEAKREPVPIPKIVPDTKPEKKEEQPKPKPKPKPEPKEPPVKKGEDIKIPKDAAKKKDLSFLEGCWRSDSGLYNSRTGEPIIGEYCFNKKGQGRRIIRERSSGDTCSGAATAQFRGNQLHIEAPEARCSRGREYVPQSVNCTGEGASTQCYGQEHGGKRNRWKARFVKK